MFNHILVPVDGSATALQAVDTAIGLAKVHGCQVTAVFVVDPYPFTGVGTDVACGQADYLSAAMAVAADSAGADLIVMGSHGRKGLEKLVLGSVTQAVLSHTKRSVLVVRD